MLMLNYKRLIFCCIGAKMGLNVYTNKGVYIVQMLPYFYCFTKKNQLLPKQITEIMVGERHKK